jgi:hypothetical protein
MRKVGVMLREKNQKQFIIWYQCNRSCDFIVARSVNVLMLNQSAMQGIEHKRDGCAKAYSKAVQNQTAIYLTGSRAWQTTSRIGRRLRRKSLKRGGRPVKKIRLQDRNFCKCARCPLDRPDIDLSGRRLFQIRHRRRSIHVNTAGQQERQYDCFIRGGEGE